MGPLLIAVFALAGLFVFLPGRPATPQRVGEEVSPYLTAEDRQWLDTELRRAGVEQLPVTWAAEQGASVRDDGSGPPECVDCTRKGCGRPQAEHTWGVFCP